MILTIRTDKPESELGLYGLNGQKLKYEIWQAHRQLSETILTKIEDLMRSQNLTYDDLTVLIFYKGPGSFTGLRIGASVANAIAYAQGINSVAKTGENWIVEGLESLTNGQTENLVPFYGSDPHITQQKK